MANYNVDDILEELRQKKSADAPPPAAPRPAQQQPAAPFCLTGMDEQPAPARNPQATRIDLPAAGAAPGKAADMSATRVMEPVLTQEQDELTRRRQDKVRNFMQNSSFSSAHPEESSAPPADGEPSAGFRVAYAS